MRGTAKKTSEGIPSEKLTAKKTRGKEINTLIHSLKEFLPVSLLVTVISPEFLNKQIIDGRFAQFP